MHEQMLQLDPEKRSALYARADLASRGLTGERLTGFYDGFVAGYFEYEREMKCAEKAASSTKAEPAQEKPSAVGDTPTTESQSSAPSSEPSVSDTPGTGQKRGSAQTRKP